MNHRFLYLVSLCLSVTLLLAGCLPEGQSLIPITGAEKASVPASVGQARENVLAYLASSSRLAAAPPNADWQLDGGEPLDGEYRFRSGDWLMVVRLANNRDENQQIVIINKIEKAYWCGYVKPDGQVVDTVYIR